MQDIVDPVTDEMLAKFVVDSHAKSKPKGALIEDQPVSNSQDDVLAPGRSTDPEVLFFFFFLLNIFCFLYICICVRDSGCGYMSIFSTCTSNVKLIFSDTFTRHAQEVYNIFQVECFPQIT